MEQKQMKVKKVLISFLGTGGENRKYEPTSYEKNGEKVNFVFQYFQKKYNFDQTYLFGTVKSLWDKIVDCDSLKNYCKRKGRETNPDTDPLPEEEKIEEVIKGKAVLLKYGMDANEIKYNSAKILKIEGDFFDDVEYHLSIDITHGFRSIPMVLLNAIIYLQNVSKKNIVIDNIWYGMREVAHEIKPHYAPIVDLKEIIDINDWIVAAYAFKEFGNTKKIVGYKDKFSGKDVFGLLTGCDSLKSYSDIINLNYVAKTEDAIIKLYDFKDGLSDDYAKLTIGNVAEQIVSKLTEDQKDCKKTPKAIKQLNIAQMQFDNMNYSNSYLTLQEAIKTFVREIKRDKDVKVEMHLSDYGLDSIYNTIRDNRNLIAHSLEKVKDPRMMINVLDTKLSEVRKIIIELNKQ